MNFIFFSLINNSEGLGGIGPEVATSKCGMEVLFIISSIATSPVR